MTTPLDRLLAIMATLRDPARGCPWDIEQTFATIAPHTIEEAYEVAEAIEQGDLTALKDELGDLLFQVVFYAQMAGERGLFDFQDVARGIADKMERRHPHVFGDANIDTAEAQTVAWETTKERERHAKAGDQPPSVLDGVSTALPALTRAAKVQGRAARVGFDWPEAAPVVDKIREEAAEIEAELAGADPARLDEEMGDLLFSCVNLARKLKIDGEGALRRATRKFEGRFRRVEQALTARGRTPHEASLAEMDALWEQVKREDAADKG
ncbi:MAG: nucleoside triphosphate pyrophosphohydrolase [Alphaproteobacteria bacterium]|nr:nucleoside triphosphate pyrophosphohydrolase [Alphaproteobacteria bacterium]